ncbi:MAG: LCP family protein [Treponema sp.]|nr:LCP family protein [Treponema sp.]
MRSKIHIFTKDTSPVLLGIIVFFLVGGIIVTIFLLDSNPVDEILSNDQVISVLYVIEKNQKPLCTYVLMCYPQTKKAVIYDIPEELGMLIRKINRIDRIDTVYNPNDITNYKLEINRLLGVDITFFIAANTENIGKAVDIIEGVELFIPASVSIHDEDELVLFPSGINRLDGDKAVSYISFSAPDEESEMAVSRRQQFFLGFLKRQAEMNEMLKISSVSQMYQSFLRTDLNQHSLVRLLDIFSGIDIDRINIQLVGGNMREVSGKMLLIPYFDGSLVKDIVRQVLTTLTDTDDSSMGVRVFTVDILNGTSVTGLAGRTAEVLRGFGYDIITVKNADHSGYEKTVIIDRSGYEAAAKKFADIIRCNNIRQEYSGNEEPAEAVQNFEYKSDFILIIGRDFNGRYVTGN